MKRSLATTLLVALALTGTAHAQMTLENFSSFTSPQTLFYGDWSATADPFVGSELAIASFTQGAGVFDFASGTNADTAFVERSFTSAVDIGAYRQLSLSLQLLADNTAESLTVTLFDRSARSAFATFLAADFNSAGVSEQTLTFTFDAGFEFAQLAALRLSGNDPFASGTLSVSIDQLVATGAVPEPATYGVFGAAALGVLAFIHRRRRA